MRFLKDSDYDALIRTEILRLIDGSTPELNRNVKLLTAEQMAMKQIRNRLSGRFDMNAVLIPAPETGEDPRDMFMVMICIDLTLYHLYSQTPHKDIPTHRQNRYQDAIDWLRDASLGNVPTDLPPLVQDDQIGGEIRIWSERPPEDQTW